MLRENYQRLLRIDRAEIKIHRGSQYYMNFPINKTDNYSLILFLIHQEDLAIHIYHILKTIFLKIYILVRNKKYLLIDIMCF